MDQRTFERLLAQVRGLRDADPSPAADAYATGAMLGLRRARYGVDFSASESGSHDEWMKVPRGGRATPELRWRRLGYRDGFAGRVQMPVEGDRRGSSGSEARPARGDMGKAPSELLAVVDLEAAREGVSRQAWILAAIREKLGAPR